MTNLTNLQQEARKISLSAHEKAVMRAQIFGEERSAQTPVQNYTVSHFRFFSIRFMPVMATLLIVMLGAGTTYAAQAALPGDMLYTIKVGVNEPVRGVLAVSAGAKVAFHTEVAETRLEEAEALAAEGRLSVSTSEQIETSFETHLARAEKITMEVEEENPDDSVDISAQLDSVLAAHGSILATLGAESDDAETKERSSHLATRLAMRISVRDSSEGAIATMSLKVETPESAKVALMVEDMSSSSEEESFSTMTMQAPTELSTSSDNPSSEATRRAAEQLEEKAEEVLEEAQDKFDDIQASLDATTTARVNAQFKTLESQLTEGKAMYEAEEYMAARWAFSSVLGDASALGAYLNAEKRFSRNLLRSWVDDRFGRVLEVEWESETESEVKGESTDQEDDNRDGKDGEDGRDGKDGKDGKEDDSHSSVEVKVNLGL